MLKICMFTENKKLENQELDPVAGGLTMGYDPRFMDCPRCGHHMLKRKYVRDERVIYKCDFCGQSCSEFK